MVDEHEVCGLCGNSLPCHCVDSARATGRFRLLPSEGSDRAAEEPFTGLLREVKGELLRRPFLQDEGRPLLDRMRRIGRLIEEGELAQADALASDCVNRVVEFPARRRHRPTWLVALVAVLLALFVAVIGYWVVF